MQLYQTIIVFIILFFWWDFLRTFEGCRCYPGLLSVLPLYVAAHAQGGAGAGVKKRKRQRQQRPKHYCRRET